MLNKRSANLDNVKNTWLTKEIKLDEKKIEIDKLNSKVEEILKQQEDKLMEISGITVEEGPKDNYGPSSY